VRSVMQPAAGCLMLPTLHILLTFGRGVGSWPLAPLARAASAPAVSPPLCGITCPVPGPPLTTRLPAMRNTKHPRGRSRAYAASPAAGFKMGMGMGMVYASEPRLLRILCADKLEDAAIDQLRASGHEVVSRPELSSDEDLVAALTEVEPNILVVRSTKVDAVALAATPSLELVIRAGAGVDNIALDAAVEAGVKVANCAGANAASVAELALGLMLACDRRIVTQDVLLKNGLWMKASFGDGRARGLNGKVLGIVGFGRIGRQLGGIGQALGMQVVAWNRSPLANPPPGVELVSSLGELAAQSDVVSVHAAPPAEGCLLDAGFFAAMKKGAIFINVARGGVVDEGALLDAIDSKSLLVGADVYEGEPAVGNLEGFDSALAKHPSVVGTMHVGAATAQAQEAVGDVVLEVINTYSASSEVMNAVC
jgi:D-3-phosphoglycerate dehydrogenase